MDNENSPSIYIVGAQCTGKSTLAGALRKPLHQDKTASGFHTISEVARTVMHKFNFTREDLSRPDRAILFQRCILRAQYDEESKYSKCMILSDRSGIDPLVYALRYGPPGEAASIATHSTWLYLKARMKRSLVVVCPPRKEWLVDDGTRLMTRDFEDWYKIHVLFLELLSANDIPYVQVPSSAESISDRVQFVLHHWRGMQESLQTRQRP